MGAVISSSYYVELHRKADRAAARLVLTYHLAPEDRHDLRQDLLVDFLRRIKSFDPCRGTFGAFSKVVLGHGMARIAVHLRHVRSRHAPMSLDDPINSPDGATLGATFKEDDGYLAFMGNSTNTFSALETRLSVITGLCLLSPEHRRLCADLVSGKAADCGMSRATHYRRMRDLRLCALAAGLRPEA
jgi:Sigma-70 region 2